MTGSRQEDPSERSARQPARRAPRGEMAALIAAKDWSKTALGPMEDWSPSLRMMTTFLLANRFPLLLWWGPDLVSLYNDAYAPILGTKHPQALGQPVRECWSEIWHILRPLILTPLLGGPSTWSEDLELEILSARGELRDLELAVLGLGQHPRVDPPVVAGPAGRLRPRESVENKNSTAKRILRCRTWPPGVSRPSTLRKAHPCSLPANPSRLLSKSSYGNCAVSKEGGRADKYAGKPCAIVWLSELKQTQVRRNHDYYYDCTGYRRREDTTKRNVDGRRL